MLLRLGLSASDRLFIALWKEKAESHGTAEVFESSLPDFAADAELTRTDEELSSKLVLVRFRCSGSDSRSSRRKSVANYS